MWADDPMFEISDHVRSRALPSPGSETSSPRVRGAMAVPLPHRDRPLWDLTFVEGLADHKVAVIERLHHAMSNSLATAALATVLLDDSPEPQLRDVEGPWIPRDAPPVWKSAMDDLLRLGGVCMRAVLWGDGRCCTRYAAAEAAELASGQHHHDAGDHRAQVVTEWLHHGRPLGGVDPSVICADTRRRRVLQCHGQRCSLDDRDRWPASPARAPGRAEREERAAGSRSGGPSRLRGESLANSISALFVRLPIGLGDPVEVLRRVSTEVKADKHHHQTLVVSALLRLFDPLPQGVMATASGIVHRQPFVNLIVTNVPGPPVPLYALGARLLTIPLARGNQGLGVAALSYDGQLNLGVLSDPATLPDVGVFCEGVASTLHALTERARNDQGTDTAPPSSCGDRVECPCCKPPRGRVHGSPLRSDRFRARTGNSRCVPDRAG